MVETPAVLRDFPGLENIVYLDSAATSQKPTSVLEAMHGYYTEYCANVHRGAYALSSQATDRYEEARAKVAAFIGAPDVEHVVFTRGTTESLNMLASGLCRTLEPGALVALSTMEHHSNLVPWQQWAEQLGLRLEWITTLEDGTLCPDSLDRVLELRPAVVSLTWVSNVFGTVNPVRAIADRVHEYGGLLVVDGAQGVPHLPCNVQELGCDFLAFSGHKMLGPTGIGVLWGNGHLRKLPPFQFGGSMIGLVTRERTSFADLPQRLEAGTPPIAEAIGLGAAVDYLCAPSMARVRQHEQELLCYALQRLRQVRGVRLVGPGDPEKQSGVIAFQVEGTHPHDVATVLDRRGVCIRAGHHCCQPLMSELTERWTPGARANVSLVRASFYLYNQTSDVDALVDGLNEAAQLFRR
jgi:cysteine desulfurase / selenocysteine lyase